MGVSHEFISAMKDELLAAPRRERTRLVLKWAELTGFNRGTIWRLADIGGRKTRADKGKSKYSLLEEWTQTVFAIKKRCPEDVDDVSLGIALETALREGHLPPEAARVSASTYNRTARLMGLNKKRRHSRFQAGKPNEAHMVDASTSSYFYIHKKLDNGDYVLRMHRPSKDYKNKPVPLGLRPWIYGLIDDYSRFRVARYVAAAGESLADNLDFLCWAWSDKQAQGVPFCGLPDMLVADQGPLMKGAASQEFLDRLEIKKMPGRPYRKERQGKIEGSWKQVWRRFEKQFLLMSGWDKFEITLSALNQRLSNWLKKENSSKHPYFKDRSRVAAWLEVSKFGGVLPLPENALKTVVSRTARVVDGAGLFSLDGVEYEVKGLHDARVWVVRGIFEDKLVVVDKLDGKKYEVKDFKPNAYGEYKGHVKSGDERMREIGESLPVANIPHGEEKSNVVYFPPRKQEAKKLEDPLNTSMFRDVEEAIRSIARIVGWGLDEETREFLRTHLSEEGRLDREYVKDLALDMRGEALAAGF